MSETPDGLIDTIFPEATQQLRGCELIDYDHFQVIKGITGKHILIVEKKDPDPRINPMLVPLQYVRQPDYWEIQLIGCLIGIVPPPNWYTFPVSLGLASYMGKKGITLVGATSAANWDLPT